MQEKPDSMNLVLRLDPIKYITHKEFFLLNSKMFLLMWQPRIEKNIAFISNQSIFLNFNYNKSEFWRFR